jgi:hypothetical protein
VLSPTRNCCTAGELTLSDAVLPPCVQLEQVFVLDGLGPPAEVYADHPQQRTTQGPPAPAPQPSMLPESHPSFSEQVRACACALLPPPPAQQPAASSRHYPGAVVERAREGRTSTWCTPASCVPNTPASFYGMPATLPPSSFVSVYQAIHVDLVPAACR